MASHFPVVYYVANKEVLKVRFRPRADPILPTSGCIYLWLFFEPVNIDLVDYKFWLEVGTPCPFPRGIGMGMLIAMRLYDTK